MSLDNKAGLHNLKYKKIVDVYSCSLSFSPVKFMVIVNFTWPNLSQIVTLLCTEKCLCSSSSSASHLSRYLLSAEGGGGHHRGGGGGRGMLLLRTRSPAPHAVIQRCLWTALAGMGGRRHQVRTRGLQHQRQQRSLHVASIRLAEDPHYILCQGKLLDRFFFTVIFECLQK